MLRRSLKSALELARHEGVNICPALTTGIHSALERVLGSRVTHPAVLEILSRCGGPTGIGTTGARRLAIITVKRVPRLGARLVRDFLTALGEQSVVVPGTEAAEVVLSELADSLKEVLAQRNDMALEVERILDDHPLFPVLTSMPGVGARTAARILLQVGDGSTFASAGHLASHVGITSVTPCSGSPYTVNTPHSTGTGNSSEHCSCPPSPPWTTPQAAPSTTANEPKARSRNAALICLARRRCDVLHSMLKNKEPYRTPSPATA